MIRVISVRPKDGQPVSRYGITREDVRIIQETIPAIQSLVPVRQTLKHSIFVGEYEEESMVVGTNQNYDRGNRIKIEAGRFLSKHDVESRSNVAVIHAKHAASLFPSEDPIGQVVRFNRGYFTVVGVTTSKSRPFIYIPHTTMRSRFGDKVMVRLAGKFEVLDYELSELQVTLISKLQQTEVVQAIEAILQRNHSQRDYEIRVAE